MKTPLVLCLALLASFPVMGADDADLVKTKGTLLFEDSFNRKDATPDKEDIGNGWTSNSAWRAKGKKQVAVADGVMSVTKAPEADHGVAIFHEAAFQNGAVAVKFKLGTGDDLGVDFVDRDLKTVHAGHLCQVHVTLKNIRLVDQKTGGMDLKIRERRQIGDKSPELTELLKTKSTVYQLDLQPDEWHHLLVVLEGDVMRVTVDDKAIGQFKSEGIAHPTKRILTLGVNKSAKVSEVKAWKLN